MKIQQSFVVARPVPIVWAFFHDIPKVAECLPGADYLGPGEDGSLSGKVSAKVGPFQASFEGEAKVDYDDADHKVDFNGKGVDRKGASRGKMSMTCRLFPDGQSTRVSVDADVQLSGAIAQFGRTGLITEVANQLVAVFVSNAEAELARTASATHEEAPAVAARPAGPSATPPPPIRSLNITSLFFAALKSWFGKIFGRAA